MLRANEKKISALLVINWKLTYNGRENFGCMCFSFNMYIKLCDVASFLVS